MKRIKFHSILFCLLFCVTLVGQAQNSIVLKDSTILLDMKILTTSPIERQYEIQLIDKNKEERHLTPKDVIIYREKNKTYLSKTFTLNGRETNVFLERILNNDTISLYIFREEGEKDLALYEGKDGKLIPITKMNNPFLDYLKTFPIVHKNPELAERIESTPPTPLDLLEEYRRVKKNNLHLYTRFRWGVMLSGAITKIHQTDEFSISNESHFFIGAFADIPVLRGFSFHPEIYYQKNSQSNNDPYSIGIVFNRESIWLPLLARFSFINVKSRTIPYLQLGPELAYVLEGKTEWYKMVNKSGVYKQIEEQPVYTHGKFRYAVNAGLGFEYKLNDLHSLFIDVRYRIEPLVYLVPRTKTNISSIFITASYNL